HCKDSSSIVYTFSSTLLAYPFFSLSKNFSHPNGLFFSILSYNEYRTDVRLLWRRSYMRYLSEDELKLATRFLFLSMAIIVMEKDIQHIQRGAFKIKEPYTELLGKMITRQKTNVEICEKPWQTEKSKLSRSIKTTPFHLTFSYANGGKNNGTTLIP